MRVDTPLDLVQTPVGTPPPVPETGYTRLYSRAGTPYYKLNDGSDYPLGGGFFFQAREWAPGWWGNVTLLNNTANNYTTVQTFSGGAARGANLGYLEVDLHAQSAGNVNQAITYSLEVSINGGSTYFQSDSTSTHNNGGASPDLGTTLRAWVPMTAGNNLTFRVNITIQNGSPNVVFGMGNATMNWFTTGGPVTGSPTDTGWLSLPLAANWQNYPGWQPAQYRKYGDWIELRGLIQRINSAYTPNTTILQVPGNTPPAAPHMFATIYINNAGQEVSGRVDINPTSPANSALTCGNIVPTSGYLALYNIRYSLI